ncbi:MAG: hypothetical protein M1387_06875 [Thaumarchaeota archaeon]|nr:hypothetical protein [Nitrososphaerota archaeon]
MGLQNESEDDILFKVSVVETILAKRPEDALQMLSKHYKVTVPALHVGMVKGRSTGVLGVYVAKKHAIYVRDSEVLFEPFVLIHEFYHHLRTHGTFHRGTEKHADLFADSFIKAYLYVKGRAG